MTKHLTHLRIFAGLGLALSLSAVAQTRFCIGGDLDHLSAEQRSACNAKVEALHKAADSLPIHDDWHFVVVCSEQAWKDYAAYAFASEDALQSVRVSTDRERHEVFFRESALHTGDSAELKQIVVEGVRGEGSPGALATVGQSTPRAALSSHPTGL